MKLLLFSGSVGNAKNGKLVEHNVIVDPSNVKFLDCNDEELCKELLFGLFYDGRSSKLSVNVSETTGELSHLSSHQLTVRHVGEENILLRLRRYFYNNVHIFVRLTFRNGPCLRSRGMVINQVAEYRCYDYIDFKDDWDTLVEVQIVASIGIPKEEILDYVAVPPRFKIFRRLPCTDVTITVRDSRESLKAHKSFLVRSPVLKASFESGMGDTILDMSAFSMKAVKIFLHYVYQDEMKWPVEDVKTLDVDAAFEVLQIAQKYKVPILEMWTRGYLRKNVIQLEENTELPAAAELVSKVKNILNSVMEKAGSRDYDIEIVEERKMERKQNMMVKRLQGIQRINEMTENHPLDLFPEEIWELIFQDESLNHEDRLNAYHAHPWFLRAMGTYKVRDVLLPLAYRVETFRNVSLGYLDRLADARSISQSMRNTFDTHLQDRFTNALYGMSLYAPTSNATIQYYTFEQRVKLDKMLKTYEDNLRPRFVLNHLCFSYNVDNSSRIGNPSFKGIFNDFKGRMISLLGRVGCQLWFFELNLRLSVEDTARIHYHSKTVWEWYGEFQSWLVFMSNIKWLKISLPSESVSVVVDGSYEIPILNEFPCLPSLERITFNFNYDQHPPLETYTEILKANQHVQRLDFIQMPNGVFPVMFGKLESFSITSLSLESKEGLPWFEFSSLMSANPINMKNLKVISLECLQNGTTAKSVCILLGKIQTLEKVNLSFQKDVVIADVDELVLPNLMDFKVTLQSPSMAYNLNIIRFFSLQFLIQCKKLTSLQWSMNGGVNYSKLSEHLRRHENLNVLDFRAGLRVFPGDSKIWKVFPSLEGLNVSILHKGFYCEHKYRREGMSLCSSANTRNCVVNIFSSVS